VTETAHYGLVVLLCGAVGLVSVLSNRVTERLKIPAPLLVLAGATLVVNVSSQLHALPELTVERVVTVALVVILFDGGMHIGWGRLREAVVPTLLVGVLGTFLTTAAAAVLMHLAFGLEWYLAGLLATAVAPTDPAVVFSVLGGQEIRGRSGTILEGESGANDPVGIALLASLLAAGSLSASAFGQVGLEFLLQMAVGVGFGVVGGLALGWFSRRLPLPSEALYPLRTLAAALMLYGVTTVAHGSGFLAVFVAGIVVGDLRVPYQREVEQFHSALASLSEIVAFVVLGSTVDLEVLTRRDVLVPGLVLGAVLAVVIRPAVVGGCLAPARLQRNELTFVMFAGLKGAVPILLGEMLLRFDVPEAQRLFGIVVVVVVLSVLVQGALVPTVAQRLGLLATLEPDTPAPPSG
jgi:cell volume regulation protein A